MEMGEEGKGEVQLAEMGGGGRGEEEGMGEEKG